MDAGCDRRGMSELAARDDRWLLAAVASGDEAALAELYDRHAPWLAVRLSRRCNDRDAVAAAIQDTFLAAWNGARKWQGQGEARRGCGASPSAG
jgi:RNA polymerase sigma-70 factor (ECF subfamily)